MKKVNVSRRSRTINVLLAQARSEDLILQAADGTEYLLSPLEEFDREIIATRRNEKVMAYLDECARQTDLVPLEEVKRQYGISTKAKARGGTRHARTRTK